MHFGKISFFLYIFFQIHSSRRLNSSALLESDEQANADGYDVSAGYMSDGDILRSSHLEDMNSGYMSEGGASLYARRLQQRFLEGIMAVQESMEDGTRLTDDDR